MIRKPQDILAWSLAEVGTGRCSVEASLAAHPEARDEMEPLLRLALALQPPDLPKAPTALRLRIRAQLRQQAEVDEQTAAWRSTLAGIARSLVTPFAQPILRFPKALRMSLCSAAALAVLMTGLHHAAASSLPGEPLYTVKRWEETVTLSLAGSPEEKAQKHLALAQRRLHEAQLLFLNGAEGRAKATVLEYSKSIATGLSYVAITEEAQWTDDQSANQVLEEYQEAFEIFQMSVAFSPGLWSADTRVILEKRWEGFVESEDDTEVMGEEQDASGQSTNEKNLDTQAQTPSAQNSKPDRGSKLQSVDGQAKASPVQSTKPDRAPKIQSGDGQAKASPAQSTKPDRGPKIQSDDGQAKASPAQSSKPDRGPKVQSGDGQAKASPAQSTKPDRAPKIQSGGDQAKTPPAQSSKTDHAPKIQSGDGQAKTPPAQSSRPNRGPKLQSADGQAKTPPAQSSKPDRGPKLQSGNPESRELKAKGGRVNKS